MDFGGILGGLGSLAGGLSGLFGGGVESAGEQFKSAFRAKMKMGERFGISKLVMAGVPANYAPYDDSIGADLANMGAGLGRVASSIQTAPERAIAQATLANMGAQNELIKAQTRSINMRTLQQAVPPRPIGIPIPRPKPGSGNFNPGGMFGPRADIPGHRTEAPTHTSSYRLFGQDFWPNNWMSDAAVFENLAGDDISFVTGPLWLAHELAYQSNMRKALIDMGAGAAGGSPAIMDVGESIRDTFPSIFPSGIFGR